MLLNFKNLCLAGSADFRVSKVLCVSKRVVFAFFFLLFSSSVFAVTISSTSTGGLWSSPSTWVGGVAPGIGDDVVITDGATVTINLNTPSLGSVTIGQGASGVLQYDDAGPRTVIVTGNVTIASRGTFLSAPASSNSAIKNNSLIVGGNLVNNGTINFSAANGTGISGAEIIFNGASNSSFDCSNATLTNLRQTTGVTLNKGTPATSTLSFIPGGTFQVQSANTAGFLSISNGTFKLAGTNAFSNPVFNSGATYTIPSNGGFWLNNPNATVVGQNGSVNNDGLLRITTGVYNVGNGAGNELQTTGTGTLNIEGGTVNVTGRVYNSAGEAKISGGLINISTIGHTNAGVASFHMSLSTKLTISGNPTIVLQNPNLGAAGDIIILNSTGEKSITGGVFQLQNAGTYKINSATPLHDLTIQNSSASVHISPSIIGATTYTYDLTVASNLSINGRLFLNNQNLIIGATAPAISGTLGSANGMIVTNGSGELRKHFSSPGSYTFPLGTSTGISEYSPITVSFTAGTFSDGAHAGVKVVNAQHPNNTNTTDYLKRYWSVATSGITNPSCNVTATYVAADVMGTEASIAMGKYNGSAWVKFGAVNATNKTITTSGLTDVGSVAFSGVRLALPTCNITGTNIICSNQTTSFIADAVAGATYSWTGPVGYTPVNGQSTGNITIAGIYTLKVDDGTGGVNTCTRELTVNTVPSAPTITPGGPTTFCTGGSVTLTSSSASGNQWLLNGSAIAGATATTYVASASGNYTVTATANGCTSPASAQTSVTVNLIPATPTVTASGPTTFCTGGSVTLTSSAASGNQWLLNGSAIAGATANTYVASASGNYTVSATANGCTSPASAQTSVTVNLIPSTPTVTASGPTTFCTGGSVTLTSSAASGNQWLLNGSSIAGATANTYVASASGTYTVTATANSCTSPASASTNVTVTPTAAAASVLINANPGNNICAGTSVTFTASPTNGGVTPSYQWKVNGVNAGTNSPTFTSSTLANTDKITVVLTPSTACSSPATSNQITMTVNDLATPSVSITSTAANICPATSVTFNASAINGGASPSYQWKINGAPAGTNSASFTSTTLSNNDQVTVEITSNAVCASPVNATSNAITIVVRPAAPATPVAPSGTTPVCPGTSNITYTVPAVANATSYNWTLPAGWTGASTTNSITVSAGTSAASGNISVSATNSCGTGATSGVAVVVSPGTPATPGAISGTTPVCPGTNNLTYSVAPVPNATSYTWILPSGWTGTSTTNSITVSATTSAANGDISVTATNSCGTSTASTLPVTVSAAAPAAPAAISGTTPVCPGTTNLTYTVPAVPNATSYTWALPSGWTGTSTTNSITVAAGLSAVSGDIKVTATNSCGTSSGSTLPVIVSAAAPATPAAITGTTPVCPGTTALTYSIAPVTNASSYTWAVPTGWTITSANGGTSITVTAGTAGQNGNISVEAKNLCGISSAQTKAVVVSAGTPETPGAITGAAEQCINKTGLVYSVTAVPNATSYSWTLPPGWTGTSTTNTITVSTTGTAVSGTISVVANNTCGISSSQTIAVSVSTTAPSTPTAPTGSQTSVCPVLSGLIYTVNAVAGATSYIWSLPFGWTITAGSGTNSITVTATSTAVSGNITVKANNACNTSASSAALPVTVGNFAFVNAGLDQTICSGGTVQLAATVGGATGSNNITWTASVAGGNFSPTNKKIDAVYTPSAAAVAAGSVTLTITSDDPSGNCVAVNDQLVVTIKPTPTATISALTPVCSGSTSTVTFTGTPNTTVTYKIGTGANQTIAIDASGAATLPTAALTANTTYTLVSVAYTATPACSVSVTGSATVTVNSPATANANVDQTVCASSPAVTLSGSVGGAATSGTWSGGAGSFTPNATALNAVYTPTSAEIAAGTVTLTLTTNDPTGPCGSATDQMVITINPSATANANIDQTVCALSSGVTLAGSVGGAATTGTWSGGAGGFTPNATTLNAVYTPTAAEIAAGTVTLTLSSNDPSGPCGAATDQMLITINPSATANANVDQTVCAGSPTVTLAGSIGGAATTGTWSGGAGSFAPDANTLSAVYTPTAAEVSSGSVTLTLTTNDPPGPCGVATDQVVITISSSPTANANADQVVCAANPAATLAGAIGGAATSATWSGGAGSFAPSANALNAVYTPTAAEITAGTVTLTLTTNDPAGPCGAASDQMVITIGSSATVSAGTSSTICSNATATMAGSFGGSATSATWSTSGSGTFSNNTPGAVYTPGAADISAGTVTLTYTTDDPAGPCGPASANVILTIKKAVVITTQPSNTSACASFPADLNVVAIGDGLTYQWFKGTAPNGTPVANSASITGAQTSNLHFNQAALSDDGTYYVVVSGISPCSPVTSAQRTLNVDQAISITTQPSSQTLCTGGNVTFSVVADANGDPLSYQWRKNGAAISGQTSSTLVLNNIGATDAANYDVVISGPSGYTCTSAQSAIAALTVTPPVGTPVFAAGTPTTRCQGAGNVTYAATATNSTAITYSLDATSVGAGNAIEATTGVVTYAAGWSGTSVITAAAAGCKGPTTATHTVTVTPSVVTSVFAKGATSVRCQGAGGDTYTATATNSTGITYSLDATSTNAGNSINSTSGVVTFVAGWSGTSVITSTAVGCNGPTTATHSVTITPTVGTPVFASGTTSTKCQGTSTVTYTATAANNTGITYSLDAPSLSAGNSINTSTGAVTYVANWSGTSIITATAAGCNGPTTATHTVTVTPSVGTPVFASGTSSSRCQAAGSVTYTATATNTAGITYSLDAASLAAGNAINTSTGAVTYVAGWSGSSVITANAAGCNGPATATHTVTVYAPSGGGAIAPAVTTVCANAAGGSLTLTGHTGSIVRWESSTNGGATWNQIANISGTQAYSTGQTTLYRAVIKSGDCPIVYSTNAVVSVIPPSTPTAVATPSTICVGGSSVLTSGSGLPSGTSGIDGSFDQANPDGWCVDGKCTGSFLSANGNNQQTGPWRETNPHDFVGINYTSPDPKFAIANGNLTSILETPVFSLIGQSPASLNFLQSFILNAGSSAKIEISTNGGATYTNLLALYTGTSSLGISGNNSTMQSTNISLANYIGLSNLKIRFTYTGLDLNSAWVIDGLGFPGTPTPVVYNWTASDGSTLTGTPATVSPITTTTYTLNATMGGCVLGSTTVTVTVNNVTAGAVGADQTICSTGDPAAFTETAQATGSGTLSYQWQSNTTGCNGTWANIGGTTSTTYNVPSGLTQTTYFRRVAISTLNTVVCSANSNCITINVNSVTPGAISGSQTICSEGDPDAFTAGTGASGSGTLSYQWQSSTTNCTSGFTNILGATSPTYDPPAGLTVKTYYRRIVISTLNNIQCTATSNCVTVDVNTIMTIATCSKTDATCNGTSTGSVSAGALTGAVGSPTYSWKNAADQVVGNAASVNNLPAGVYTLTVKDNCTTRDCQVTIVEPPLLSASILGSTTVCQGDPSPKVTFTNPQAFPVTITYNINGGANLTVSVGTNTTATVDVLTTNPGTFTYNLVSVTQQGAPSCSNTVSGTPATVIVNPKPAPVIIYHN